jgi:hypothetical protein
MATHKGSEGLVKSGSNTIAEVTGFSFDETADTIETTALSNSAHSFVTDLVGWSGSVDCFWDETDTSGQGSLTAGASVTLNLYNEGDGAGATYYTGTALITSISRANGIGAIVTANFSFTGTGALASATV